ncbi:MAG: hypothetical protein LC623_06295 [Halobacteriales archaeon]|nr:hypothetical protein [Halobacteriales archaeon]
MVAKVLVVDDEPDILESMGMWPVVSHGRGRSRRRARALVLAPGTTREGSRDWTPFGSSGR